MDIPCEDDSCMDDALWRVKEKDAAGKEHEHELCEDHMKAFVASSKERGVSIIGIDKIEDEDDEDIDEAEGDEDDEESAEEGDE